MPAARLTFPVMLSRESAVVSPVLRPWAFLSPRVGLPRTFAVVTGQTDPNLDNEIDFAALAKMDTVVVLMGRKNLQHLTESLIAAGRDPETPVAAIENATLPTQRVVAGSLATISSVVEKSDFGSPMVTVIGAVAAMVDQDQLPLPAEVLATLM